MVTVEQRNRVALVLLVGLVAFLSACGATGRPVAGPSESQKPVFSTSPAGDPVSIGASENGGDDSTGGKLAADYLALNTQCVEDAAACGYSPLSLYPGDAIGKAASTFCKEFLSDMTPFLNALQPNPDDEYWSTSEAYWNYHAFEISTKTDTGHTLSATCVLDSTYILTVIPPQSEPSLWTGTPPSAVSGCTVDPNGGGSYEVSGPNLSCVLPDKWAFSITEALAKNVTSGQWQQAYDSLKGDL